LNFNGNKNENKLLPLKLQNVNLTSYACAIKNHYRTIYMIMLRQPERRA
jgi:hypothetical protein